MAQRFDQTWGQGQLQGCVHLFVSCITSGKAPARSLYWIAVFDGVVLANAGVIFFHLLY